MLISSNSKLRGPDPGANALTGIAGVHFVVSELSRRRLVALPTIRNVAAYDILVANTAGTHHANIQVKASLRRVTFFPMPEPEKVRAGKHDHYVLVRWIERQKRFEGFLLSGRAAREAVERSQEFQEGRIRAGTRKKVFHSIYVGPKNVKAVQWQKTWESWTLPAGVG